MVVCGAASFCAFAVDFTGRTKTMQRTAREATQHWSQGLFGPLMTTAVILGVLGLPLVLWLDLTSLSESSLQSRATETGRVIDIMRGFYSSDVVGRIQHAEGKVTTNSNYKNINGAVPIPATLSIELGNRISEGDGAIKYRFVSDLPFKDREAHLLDSFEVEALRTLRADPKAKVAETSGTLFNRELRIASPVIMGQACVDCHNSHPASPKKDWKVGDVRGIQEVAVLHAIDANIFSFKYLLSYIALASLAGVTLLWMQRRQSQLISLMNTDLAETNNFLADVSVKIAKYISPQIYKSIFSGQRDVTIATERKKLTIFFSDIKDFTATAERLQPEDLTNLLNEYLTNMSSIALEHGGTVDKFIGDAILVFFGDPETKGIEQDAKACLNMAIDMKARLEHLNKAWRRKGIEIPFKARMGINTGFCNVGNFGSEDRMDYTIIGAEANFAARLQTVAEPGEIVLSYETYELVRDMVSARPRAPISLKGISRKVVPYVVDGVLGEVKQRGEVISGHAVGLDLFLDTAALNAAGIMEARNRLKAALLALDATSEKPA
jgi:adenylate cyclase